MPRGNQVIRQWRLLQLVSRPAGLTIADAARELDCSGRTVWRDLADLQTAGFPIYDDRSNGSREGVWRVEASFQSRLPLPIALDEALESNRIRDHDLIMLNACGGGLTWGANLLRW